MHILFHHGHSSNPTNQAILKEVTTSHAWPSQKPTISVRSDRGQG